MSIASWLLYKLTPTVRTDGVPGPAMGNSLGQAFADLATKLAGEDVGNDAMGVVQKFLPSGATASPPGGGAYNVTIAKDTALALGLTIGAVPAVLHGFELAIDATAPTAIYYIQICNQSAVTSYTPLICPIPIAHTNLAPTLFSWWAPPNGLKCSTGITIQLSTAQFSWVQPGASYTSNTIYYTT